MGCIASSPTKVAPKQEASKQAQIDFSDSFTPQDSYNEIIQNVKTFEEVRCMTPLVCLSNDAFPIIAGQLDMQDSSPHSIDLPIVAASICGKGRVVCFSQLNLIHPQLINSADNFSLLSNVLHWVAGSFDTITTILSLGFNKSELSEIHKTFYSFGCYVENGHSTSDIKSYKAIIIPSNADLTAQHKVDSLYKYVHDDGGGLIVFSNHNHLHYFLPVNNLLLKFSLSYTFCLVNSENDSLQNLTVDTTNHIRSDLIFPNLITKFKDLLDQETIDTQDLDNLVTTLRYYIMVCNENYTRELEEISKYAWCYLNKTGYRNEELICTDIKHGIIAVLLLEISNQLPNEFLKPIPDHSIFPGQIEEDIELSNFQLTIDVQNEAWTSTGLYLPAGVIGTVEMDGSNSNVFIQIGSHHENLFPKPNPWKRWPLIVSVFPFTENVINAISPFGGIVYVSYKSGYSSTEYERSQIRLKFSNFLKYPMYDYSNKEIYEKTKDSKAPWGEIVTKYVIFTIPSDFLRNIKDFSKINKFFNDVVENIEKLMNLKIEKPFRFVFDIELLTDQPSCGYPIIFDIADMDDILISFDKPSHKLFTAITLMAICSIREDCMDRITETAVATVAAADIFMKLYPGFDPNNFDNYPYPVLFAELWEIHTIVNNEVIFQTLAKFQDPSFAICEVEEDMWVQFVIELCENGQMNFVNLLGRAYPVPLNISISLEGLPTY